MGRTCKLPEAMCDQTSILSGPADGKKLPEKSVDGGGGVYIVDQMVGLIGRNVRLPW
jgi:hypothetical protein